MSATKERIVQAALDTLKQEGFAGASARAIARSGDFNQALIFYHFGTVESLLVAALEHTSTTRLERYREALADAETLQDRIRVGAEVFREDVASGHITVVSEMIAGSVGRPELAQAIVERMEPWIDLTEAALADDLRAMGLDALLPPRTVAYGVVALFIGVDLLVHLGADDARVASLFEAAERLGPFFANLGR